MKLPLSYAVRAFFVSATLVACAVHGADDEKASSSSNAISGTIDTQRSCAAAGTYTSDGPNDFDTPADDKLSSGLRKTAGDAPLSHFKAPSVGDVYAIGSAGEEVELVDVNGKDLATGEDDGSGQLVWWSSNDTPLDCSNTPYKVTPAPFNSSSSGSSSGFSSSGFSSSGWSGSSSGSTDADGGTWTSSSSGWVGQDGGTSGDDDDDTADGGVVAVGDAGHH